MNQINILDAFLLLVFVFFGLRGLFRGLVLEVAGLLGIATGFLLAKNGGKYITSIIADYGISETFSSVLAFAALFMIGILIVGCAAKGFQRLLEQAFVGGIDKSLGLVAGLTKGFFLTSILGYIILRLLPEAIFVKNSQIIPPLMDIIQSIAGSFELHIPKI